MLLGLQQDLDRLPSHEALQGQGGYRRLGKVILGRLQRVLDAEGLPDVGDRLVRGVDEERIVVATNGLVERGELCLVEDGVVLVAYLGLLRAKKSVGPSRV
jgi:hypothetical protein